MPVHSEVRMHRQNKLTSLKQMQKTEFVSSLILIVRSQDEHPDCSSSRAGESKSELIPSLSLCVFTLLGSKPSHKSHLGFLFCLSYSVQI